jgi:TonB family protein
MIMLLIEAALRSLVLGAGAWLLLRMLRISNPKIERDAWLAVLSASLAMPWLMQLDIVSAAPAPALTWLAIADVATVTAAPTNQLPEVGLLAAYGSVTAVLLIRQVVGLARLWRVRRRASRALPSESCTSTDVRISSQVQSPMNVFSTIIVPTSFEGWDPQQRRAVIAHEEAHVRNRDFYTRQIAQLHRSIFWFSPLAWWLPRKLSMLSEHISDDAALSVMSERTAYAELLLGFARSTIRDENAVAMARPGSLVSRVDRILEDAPSPRQLGRRYVTLAMLLPIVGIASGFRATAASQDASTSAAPAPAAGTPPSDSAPATGENVVLPRSNPARPFSQPIYPPPSRRLHEQGSVTLKLHVSEKGRVIDSIVEESSGFIELDNAARYESFRWQPDPGTVDGTPTKMWGRFRVTFILSEDDL